MGQVDKVVSQPDHDSRDVAVIADLGQQYSDVLGEMIEADILLDTTVTAKVGDKLITFEDTEDFTTWLAEAMDG